MRIVIHALKTGAKAALGHHPGGGCLEVVLIG